MSRISRKFEELRGRNKKALITFVTAGDPDLATTEALVYALEQAGADLIELGVPFSDPMADGPVIQRSSERALKHHTNLKLILQLVQDIRKRSEIPIVLMGYFNPILQYGCGRFCRDAKKVGADGLIVVDLPPEESAELDVHAKRAGLDRIHLLTPTADADRIRRVRQIASGFVYYVSMTGITGTKINSLTEIKGHLKKIKQTLKVPVCIGFGIQTPQDASSLSQLADGIVVGSSLVALLDKEAKISNPIERIADKVKDFSQAIRA